MVQPPEAGFGGGGGGDAALKSICRLTCPASCMYHAVLFEAAMLTVCAFPFAIAIGTQS